MTATLCACGCKKEVKPGRTFFSRTCANQAHALEGVPRARRKVTCGIKSGRYGSSNKVEPVRGFIYAI